MNDRMILVALEITLLWRIDASCRYENIALQPVVAAPLVLRCGRCKSKQHRRVITKRASSKWNMALEIIVGIIFQIACSSDGTVY